MRKIINSAEEIGYIDESIEDVHITFRPSEENIFTLISRCSDLKSIQIPQGFIPSISITTKNILAMENIHLFIGTVQGKSGYTD